METSIHDSDHTWIELLAGVTITRWPGDEAPERDQRVVIFDRDLEFTQHKVLLRDGMRVTVGPAIPWT